ncbi:ABC-type sugar transport system, periplasmic component [Mesotoga prima MesG1.Ag.4.2]|uniref:ABC-type sugar transport system, periplasmic component n=1 Tax=Mesotoga prima MesG1.Ag.4.2 TaxID=660470 RepID=I2F5Q9_9BACT|nr:ABC transporter substrate-binding protein [Mesotoga prima]AFK07262.1 ABC-type sugar transport system, periplasmic component [Mesotoga prima MesG1.Ag.4.2]NLI08614.1 ABC transporter substrate-binding protein [Thermotogaceae bacterium]CCU84834.1 Extracellular solute-binding protein family 1 [Mesotoga infera]
MKKLLLLFLVSAFLVVTALSAEITFWKFTDTYADPTIQRFVDLWNEENPDKKVVFETFPWGDYTGTKLTTAFATGEGPDVFFISPGDFLRYVNTGIALPLSKYLTEDIIADFLPETIEAVTVGGEIYALPLEMEPVAIFYNKAAFEEKGISQPQDWAELKEAAAKLKTADRYGIIVEVAPGYYQNFTWYPFLWTAGGDVVDENWEKSAFESEGAIAALDLWGSFVKEGLAPSSLPAGANDIGMFGNGLADMIVCGFWGVKQLQTQFPEFDFGVFPIPPYEKGGESISVYGGWKMMLNAKGKNTDIAAEFARWLVAEQIDFPLDWCTVTNSKFSPRYSVLEAGNEFYNTPPNDVFLEILKTSKSEPTFTPEMVKAVSDAIQAVMFAGMDPKAAAKGASAAINAYLSRYTGGVPGK